MNFKSAVKLGVGFYIGYTAAKAIDEGLYRAFDEDWFNTGAEAVKEVLRKRGLKIEEPTQHKSDKIIGFRA